MKTLQLGIIVVVLIIGISITFSQSSNAQMQNNSSTDLKCMDNITQDAKKKYASFDEEQAKTAAINYDKFKSEIKDDKYIFRAVSQEWTNDQVNCTVTLKDVLVLFFVTDSSGKQRDVTVIIDPTSYMPQSIDVEYDVATHGSMTSITANQIDLPLKQFRSGTPANDVKCQQDLQLIIKSEDGSPACVTLQTAQKLVEHGWGWAMKTIDSLKPLLPNKITGLENDAGVITLGNQTYYFETPNYTNTAYYNQMQISFHDVVFTLFPSGFRGGLPTSVGCGSGTEGELVIGSGSYYWTDTKFPDGTHELLHIFADSPPCPEHPIPSYFSNHTNPQAGLAVYDEKIKLLVSKIPQTLSKQLATVCTAGPEMPCDNQPTAMSQNNGTLSGDVVLDGGPVTLVGSKASYEVDVYATDGVTIVAKTLADANAHYSIQLPAGNYIIYAPDYPTKQTHFVSVFSGKNTILNIVYGSGYK